MNSIKVRTRKRINFIRYIGCLSYLYHKDLTPLDKIISHKKTLNTLLVHGSLKEIENIIPDLAYYLDAANDDIQRVLHGNKWPIKFLLKAASYATHSRHSLKRYLYIQSYAENISLTQILNRTSFTPHTFEEILTHGNKMPIQDVNQIAENLDIPKIGFISDLRKAGITTSNHPDRSLKPIVVPLNKHIALKAFLKCTAYYHHHSMAWLFRSMGYKYSEIIKIIKAGSDNDIINALRQVPFVLKGVSLNDIKNILHNNDYSQKRLIKSASRHTYNRSDLNRFMYICTHLRDTNPKAISKKLGRSNNYLHNMIMEASGETLARLFDEIAIMLNIPEGIVLYSLAKANVNETDHAYKNRMYFMVHYVKSPIHYANVHLSQYQPRYDQSLNNMKMLANMKSVNDGETFYYNDVYQALSCLAKSFGFSLKNFIDDNFKHVSDQHCLKNLKYIWQGRQYTRIKNLNDWPVILRKIRQQLMKVNNAFSLPAVQDLSIAKYIYVNGVNMKRPLAKGTSRRIVKLNDNKRHEFTGKFDRTDIKIINRDGKESDEFYSPVIIFSDIKNNRKVVMSQGKFNYTKSFVKVGRLMKGDLVKFTARVKTRYVGTADKEHVKKIEYFLTYPSSIHIIRRKHARDNSSVPKNRAALTGFAIENNKSYGYDFSFKNYGYARYCINEYRHWKLAQKAE